MTNFDDAIEELEGLFDLKDIGLIENKKDGTPFSFSLVGRTYEEGAIVALAIAYQRASGWNQKHPSL